MTGKAYLTILSFTLLPLTAWITEIYDGGFWKAVYDYQTLIAGTFAVVAAVVGAIALVLATRAMIQENRNAEVRQRKARARGIANLVGAELLRRSVEAKMLHEKCVAARAKEPPESVEFFFRAIFSQDRVLGLNDELVHVAEFAPSASIQVLSALEFFRGLVTTVEDFTKDGECSIPADVLAGLEDWSAKSRKQLDELGRQLNSLPGLAD